MSANLFGPELAVRESLVRWVPAPCRVMVAVSGGVDSVALLHAMKRVAAVSGHQIVAVHVNHGLRKEADADEAFVRELCVAWDVPFVTRKVSIQSVETAVRKGVEADARNVRYQAFMDATHSEGCSVILLAHHADDQVETMLWRLCRGTGLRGLAGMQDAREMDDVMLLRPFLRLDKRQLTDYADVHGLPYVEDASNQDLNYVRNFLRHKVVPALKTVQPRLASVMARTATVLQEEDAFLHGEAQELVDRVVEWKEDSCIVELPSLRAAPRPLQRRAIQIILYCFPSTELRFSQVEDILQLVASGSPSGEIHLQENVMVRREYDVLRIVRQSPVRQSSLHKVTAVSSALWELASTPEIEFSCDGQWPWRFVRREWAPTEGIRPSSLFELRIPKLEQVELRSLSTSERVRPFGMEGHKKVQDVFTDAKVPRVNRPLWPALCAAGAVVWIPGILRTSEHLLAIQETSGWVITAQRVDLF